MPLSPSPNPNAAPTIDNITLSVSSCRMILPGTHPLRREWQSHASGPRPDQQEVCYIGTGDQENQADRAGKNQKRPAYVLHQDIAHGLNAEGVAPVGGNRIRVLAPEF